MLSNIETGSSIHLHQEVRGIRGKRIVIAGNYEVSKASAALMAGQGARVFFAAANAEDLGGLLGAVTQVQGEGKGMVANLEKSEETQRFLSRAKRQLGQIDVLVYQPAAGKMLTGGKDDLLEETLQHLRMQGSGHIIVITPSNSATAELRHKAASLGIRITRIEPESDRYGWSGALAAYDQAAGIANCIYESIAQPFAADVVFMQDPFENLFGGQVL